MKEELAPLIIKSLHDLDSHLDAQFQTEIKPDTPLFGHDGLLDSLGLVTLVVAVEQAIEERFGARVSLGDERALARMDSPYRTIGTLAEYAASLIQRDV